MFFFYPSFKLSVCHPYILLHCSIVFGEMYFIPTPNNLFLVKIKFGVIEMLFKVFAQMLGQHCPSLTRVLGHMRLEPPRQCFNLKSVKKKTTFAMYCVIQYIYIVCQTFRSARTDYRKQCSRCK